MKYCATCGISKEEIDFNKRTASKDGLSHKCKSCQKVYDKARSKDPAREEARRIYAQTEEGKITTNKAKAQYRLRNPAKAKAMAIVSRNIRSGNLATEPCEECGTDKNIHAHHDDYLKPLNVRWLCQAHHMQWHRDNGPGING